MKLNTNVETIVNISNTEFESSNIGMSADGSQMASFFLRDKIYTKKELAVVREYVANALDEHVKIKMDDPSFDKKVKISLPNSNDASPFFSVRDYAYGLDDKGVRCIFGMYFESTKRNTDAFIGGFGIGSKAGHAYIDTFYVTSWHEGMKRSYSFVVEGGSAMGVGKILLLDERKSDEPSGIEVKVPVRIEDVDSFLDAHAELAPFIQNSTEHNGKKADTPAEERVFGKIENVSKHAIKFSSEGFCRPTRGDRVVCGFIPYSIDAALMEDVLKETLDELSKANPSISRNDIASFHSINGYSYIEFLRVPIDSVDISVSREALEGTKRTKKAIKNAILGLFGRTIKNLLEKIKKIKTVNDFLEVADLFANSCAKNVVLKRVIQSPDVKSQSAKRVADALDLISEFRGEELHVDYQGVVEEGISRSTSFYTNLSLETECIIIKNKRNLGKTAIHNRVRRLTTNKESRTFCPESDLSAAILTFQSLCSSPLIKVVENIQEVKPMNKELYRVNTLGLNPSSADMLTKVFLEYNIKEDTFEEIDESELKNGDLFFFTDRITNSNGDYGVQYLDVGSHSPFNLFGSDYVGFKSVISFVKMVSSTSGLGVDKVVIGRRANSSKFKKAKCRSIASLVASLGKGQLEKMMKRRVKNVVEGNFYDLRIEAFFNFATIYKVTEIKSIATMPTRKLDANSSVSTVFNMSEISQFDKIFSSLSPSVFDFHSFIEEVKNESKKKTEGKIKKIKEIALSPKHKANFIKHLRNEISSN